MLVSLHSPIPTVPAPTNRQNAHFCLCITICVHSHLSEMEQLTAINKIRFLSPGGIPLEKEDSVIHHSKALSPCPPLSATLSAATGPEKSSWIISQHHLAGHATPTPSTPARAAGTSLAFNIRRQPPEDTALGASVLPCLLADLPGNLSPIKTGRLKLHSL